MTVLTALRLEVRGSDSAFALATGHGERAVTAPVDEQLEALQRELGGQREVAHARLEIGCAHAIHERSEGLTALALGLVEAQPALDRLGHALGGQARLEPLPVAHLPTLVCAAEVSD